MMEGVNTLELLNCFPVQFVGVNTEKQQIFFCSETKHTNVLAEL